MSDIQSVPALILMILNGGSYLVHLELLKYNNMFVYFIINTIINKPRFLNLLKLISQNTEEQVVALLYLINLAMNEPCILSDEENEEFIMNIFRTAINTWINETTTLSTLKKPLNAKR